MKRGEKSKDASRFGAPAPRVSIGPKGLRSTGLEINSVPAITLCPSGTCRHVTAAKDGDAAGGLRRVCWATALSPRLANFENPNEERAVGGLEGKHDGRRRRWYHEAHGLTRPEHFKTVRFQDESA